MEFLASSSVPVVTLDEALRHPNAVAITFDDGFRNLLDHAVPVLDRLRLPATFFVISGYCGGTNNWPSQPSGVPGLPLMDWGELASLPPWISIGAHTVTHPHLTALSDAECERELSACRDRYRAAPRQADPLAGISLRISLGEGDEKRLDGTSIWRWGRRSIFSRPGLALWTYRESMPITCAAGLLWSVFCGLRARCTSGFAGCFARRGISTRRDRRWRERLPFGSPIAQYGRSALWDNLLNIVWESFTAMVRMAASCRRNLSLPTRSRSYI